MGQRARVRASDGREHVDGGRKGSRSKKRISGLEIDRLGHGKMGAGFVGMAGIYMQVKTPAEGLGFRFQALDLGFRLFVSGLGCGV